MKSSRKTAGKKQKRRLKSYQVKLRIIGVLSLILAILAATIPLPTHAAGESAEILDIFSRFTYTRDDNEGGTSDYLITLTGYSNNAAAAGDPLVIPAASMIGTTTYKIRLADGSVFADSTNLKEVTIDEGVLSDMTSAKALFKNCTNLESVTVNADSSGTLDTSKLTDVSEMFEGCTKLHTVDITALDTENVTDFSHMFANCTALTGVDCSYLDTTSAVTMRQMFQGGAALTTLLLNASSTPALTDVTQMFQACTALETLDLSGMDFSNVTVTPASGSTPEVNLAAGFLDGCGKLVTIHSPVNVTHTEGSSTVPTRVALPHHFKYTPTDAGGNPMQHNGVNLDVQKTKELPTILSMPGGGTLDTSTVSQTLTRSEDVEEITLTPDDAVKAQELPVGESTTLTLTIDPPFAANQEVTLTPVLQPDPDRAVDPAVTEVLSLLATGGTTDTNGVVTATAANGTLQVSVNGLKAAEDSLYNPRPATVRITAQSAADPSKTAVCDVTVVQKVVPVTGISVTPAGDQTLTIGETLTLTAAVTPNDATQSATNHHVTWSSSVTDFATVSGEEANTGTDKDHPSKTVVSAVRPGTVYITAKSNHGSYTAQTRVTVVSPYGLYTQYTDTNGDVHYTDSREDASNASLTKVSSTAAPWKGDLYLYLDHGRNTPATSATSGFAAQMAGTPGVDATDRISYFTIEIADAGQAVPEDADKLGDVTITMALPGSAMYKGKTPQIYAYNGTTGATQATLVGGASDALGSDASIQAVTFTVDSADIAQEYALVMAQSAAVQEYNLYVQDNRSNRQAESHVNRTNNTIQTSDLYLYVEDLAESAAKLKTLINANVTYAPYTQRHYYDIFLASQTTNPRDHKVTGFGEITVYLALPNNQDVMNDNYRLVREGLNGNLENVETAKVIGLNNGYHYLRFTATHFSEYALIFDPTNSVVSSSTSGGGGGGQVINVSIPAINITIDGSGNATATIGSSGTTTPSSGGATAQTSGSAQTSTTPAASGNAPAGNQTASNGVSTGGGQNQGGTASPSNQGDMPKTGPEDMYRVLLVLLFGFSGVVEVLLSVPSRRRVRHA